MLLPGQKLLILLLIGIALLGLRIPFVFAKDSGWESSIRNGQQALESGNYSQAETYLNEALVNSRKFQTGDSRLGVTYHSLANLYMRQEKYSIAKEYFERAIVIEQKALGLDSLEVADALYGLSLCAQQVGDHMEAEILLKRVMEIWNKKLAAGSKQYLSILPSLAAYASMKGDYKTSELYYRQLLSLYEQLPGTGNSELAGCLNRLSAVLGYEGKYAEAETVSARALALLEKKPDDEIVLESARMNLAFIKAQNEPVPVATPAQPKKTIASVSGQVVGSASRGRSVDKEDSSPISTAINKTEREGGADPAPESVSGAADADKNSPDKMKAAGNTWGKIRYLSEGRLISQEEYKAMMLATEAYEMLKLQKYRMAKYMLARSLQVYPQLPAAHTNLGLVLTKLGQYDEAIAEFNKAIELDPKRSAPWLNLASTYQAMGNLSASIATYNKYIEKFPNQPLCAQAKVLVQNLNVELSEQQQVAKANGGNSGPGAADYVSYAAIGGAARWPAGKMPIKVFIEPHSHIENFKKEYVGFMQQAMRSWADASSGVVKFDFVAKADKADIICAWSDRIGDVVCPAEGGQTKLVISSDGIKRADIVVLTCLNGQSGLLPDNVIKAICLHEAGHALGIIGHSPVCTDAMFCTMPLADGKVDLSSRDQQTLTRLYSGQLAMRAVPQGEITVAVGQRRTMTEAEKTEAEK